MLNAGDLKKALDHIAPETPVLIEMPTAKGKFLHISKDVTDLIVRFQKEDGAPILIIKAT